MIQLFLGYHILVYSGYKEILQEIYKQENFSTCVLEAKKPKIRLPVGLLSGESSFSASEVVPSCFLTCWDRKAALDFIDKGTNPVHKGFSLMSVTLQKHHIFLVTLRLSFNTQIFRVTHIQIMVCYSFKT